MPEHKDISFEYGSDYDDNAIDENIAEDDPLFVDGEQAENLESEVYEYSISDENFWVSPEEFYEDCGCGLSTGCLTTCAEEAAYTEDAGEILLSNTPDMEHDDEEFFQDGASEEILANSEESDAQDRVENDPQEAEDDELNDSVSDDVDRTCFIATAAYADPMHPDVQFLREFRDLWLVKRVWGRLVVRIYWSAGPPAARFVGNRPVVGKAVKTLIAAIVSTIKRFWWP